jgi:hypothetical protein
MFYFENLEGNKVLKSDFLSDITHFFTTRDIGLYNQPEDFFVKLIPNRIIHPTQTHSDNVQFITEEIDYPNTDALIITQKRDLCYLRFADCTPIMFYDKRQKIAAISHAGWRGTVQRIGVKTLEKMQSNPQDVIAVIGPSIGVCCYEVSDDVKNKLLSTVEDKTNLYRNKNVDLKKINAQQLKEFGVKEIDICPYCTSCDNDLFYSYRKENGTDKRHHAVIILE